MWLSAPKGAECTCSSSVASLATCTVIGWPTLACSVVLVGVTWPLAIVMSRTGPAPDGCWVAEVLAVPAEDELVGVAVVELDVLVFRRTTAANDTTYQHRHDQCEESKLQAHASHSLSVMYGPVTRKTHENVFESKVTVPRRRS